MQQYLMKKRDLDAFLSAAMAKYDLIAPVSGKSEKQASKSFFRKIGSPREISLDGRAYHTAKGFFFDSKEVLFKFKDIGTGNPKVVVPEIKLKKRILFGLRRCDLNGIYHQDIVFLEDNPDPYYKARRDATILIGMHCRKGGKYCFCNAFELKEFFDIMMYDKGKYYALEIGSEKGAALVNEFKRFFDPADKVIDSNDRKTENELILNKTDIKKFYNHDDWKKGADLCLSCGACNFLCPNCHCFTINDDIDMSLKEGERVRKPASCQLRHFTRVAGEHIFRDSRLARFKHRIYHQMQYFKDRHNVQFCTGCGRCIEGCPVKIDWVKIINELK